MFAALSVLEGKVIGRCVPRHRHQEFIGFITTGERSVPPGKVIHAILDNYAPSACHSIQLRCTEPLAGSAHKHPEVLAWLAAHPRWTFHFTPTSCSWLNAVEGFFSKLTRQSLKRGVFRSAFFDGRHGWRCRGDAARRAPRKQLVKRRFFSIRGARQRLRTTPTMNRLSSRTPLRRVSLHRATRSAFAAPADWRSCASPSSFQRNGSARAGLDERLLLSTDFSLLRNHRIVDMAPTRRRRRVVR